MKLTAESTVLDDKKIGDSFATLQVEADGIRTEVGTKVGNDEVISRINQTPETITIHADKVDIEGTITAINNNTTTTINGGKITTGTLNADAIGAGNIAAARMQANAISAINLDASSATINSAHIPNLSATKITSDTLNAARIGSNTIDASKLTVGVQNDINSNRRNYAKLLNRVGTSATSVGVTSSVSSNFEICANGTASATGYILGTSILIDLTLDAGSYVFWCSTSALCHLRLGQGSSSTWLAEPRCTKESPYKVTLNASTRITVGVVADSGTTYSNVKMRLMIERGDTPSEWVPALEDTDVNSYVTHINNDGIRVHPSSTENNSVVINANGMEVFKGGTGSANSVAFYGDTARIGKDTSPHASVDANGFHIWKATQNTASNEVASFSESSISLGKNSLTSVINMCKDTLKMKSKYTSIVSTNDCTSTSIAAGDTTKAYNVLEVGLAAQTGVVGDVATVSKLMFETQSNGDYMRTVLTGRDYIGISLLGSALTSIGISPSDTFGYGDVDIGGLKSLRLSSGTSDFTASLWYMGGAPTTGSQSYNAIWTKSGDDCRLGRPSSSSKRYKEDIKPVENDELNPHRLYDIPVVQFKFKEDYFDESDPYNDDRYDVVGFIAEDVLEHYPRAAIVIDGEVENWNERYMLPPMLKLIQEQKKKIDDLEERIEALERKIK